MKSTKDRLSSANKSYLMDVAKRKCIETTTTTTYQSTTEEDYPDVDSWKVDRLARLREIHEKRREYLDKGCGTLEVLTEERQLVDSSKNNTRLICHFYEEGFKRCELLDGLLTSLASRFLDTKFVKIMASKAPFFAHRIGIKILPTLLAIIDGNITKIFVGFQEFNGDNINLKILRNTLLRHNILTDQCCIIDGDSEEEEETDPNN